jgi:hypothetical protein
MNKQFITVTLLLSTPGLLFPGGGGSKPEKPLDPRNFRGGVATQNLKDTVQIIATAISADEIGKSGEAATAGLLKGLDDEEIRRKGNALGESLVTGALGAVGAAVKAKGAAVASTAVAAAPIVLPLAFAGGVFCYGYNIERQKEYGHCLRTHFDSPSVDEEKMPRRCHSPQRRATWWGKDDADRQKRLFKILKDERRKPRPPVPGLPYWNNDGPNILWEKDLREKK